MDKFISVSYEPIYTTFDLSHKIKNLPNLIACDFETSSILNEKEKKNIEDKLKIIDYDWYNKTRYEKLINSDGTSHPCLVKPTLLSIAWSEKDAIVIILSDKNMIQYITNWLVETPKLQLWHNTGFDFRIIKYYTNRIPKNWEDTMLLAKCFMNHTKDYMCSVGLKNLEGHNYGDWAIAKENFTEEMSTDPKVLKYAATDACATFKLYNEIISS